MTSLVVLVVIVLAALPWMGRRGARRIADGPPGPGAASGRPVGAAGPLSGGAGARQGGAGPVGSSARTTPGDRALLLDLVAVALAAGAPVPTALTAVGSAWPGSDGEALVRAARSLALGAPWDVAWTGASGAARAVAEALRPAWSAGASPVPLLRTAAERLRSRRRAETRAAAGRLGVQLVMPLGLCHLPAFVLVGLVPVVVSFASGLLG